VNPDRPINSLNEDGFNYYPLAKQLARHLLLKPGSPSLVAGVEAPWGSGKTSFLNLTQLALNALDSPPLIFEYCPWVYSTVDSLILGFCIQIAAQLSTSDAPNYKRIGTALLGFSQALKPLRYVPGAELAMGAVDAALQTAIGVTTTADELNKWDISNAKKRVQQTLDDAGKPIVVFVDDVDRLPPAEVRLLFQFLKAVADFRAVSYVVAYDPIPVEDALSFDGKLDGKEYLKKFVQLPIRLPRLSRLSMRNFLVAAVNDIQSSALCAISNQELDALGKCATSDLVLNCTKTPRDVVRCFNLLRLRIPDCHREVELPELLKFILLDLVSPETVEFVRENSVLFLGTLLQHPEFTASGASFLDTVFPEGRDKENARAKFSKGLEKPIRTLLDSLFPLDVSLAETNMRSAHSTHGLIKLLYGGSSPMAFSVADAQAVLQNEEREKRIQDKLSAGVFREWIYFLAAIGTEELISDPCGLASCLINASDESALIHDEPVRGIRRLVAEYLNQVLAKMTDPEEAVLFVKTIITDTDTLICAHDVILALAIDAGLWKNGISYSAAQPLSDAKHKFCIPSQQIIELELLWREAVSIKAEEGDLHRQPQLFSILHRWGQFPDNDYSEPQKYIRNFCEKGDALPLLLQSGIGLDTSGLEKLLVAHEAIIRSLSTGKSEPEFRENAIKFIKQLQSRQPEPPPEIHGES